MIKNLFAAFTAFCVAGTMSSAALAESRFSDIDGSDYEWAGEAIEKVAELGIINGDSDGSFRPGDGVKKIEALLMLSRVTGSSIENYEPFVRFAEYQYSDTLDECGLADSEYRGEIAFLLYKDVLSESELIDYMDNPDAVLKVGEATRLIAELSSDPDLTNNVKTSRAPTVKYAAASVSSSSNTKMTRARMAESMLSVYNNFDYYSITGPIEAVTPNDDLTVTISIRNDADDTVGTYIFTEDMNVIIDGEKGRAEDIEVGSTALLLLSHGGFLSLETLSPAVEEAVNKALAKTGVYENYVQIPNTFDYVLQKQLKEYNVVYGSSIRRASTADVRKYLDPDNYCEGSYKYQFLDLSRPNNMTADQLNEYLEGRGILDGMGQAFIDAANEYGVSEIYLVAHACLETGHGTSTLSRGVTYNGQKVYNMFGIGAYDGNAVAGGSAYAYKMGWTTPEAAIKGGAEWIAKYYIHRPDVCQNTLYKMRWNPESPGEHQYATDVGWAVKQAQFMATIVGDRDCLQVFEIPVYETEE